MGKVTALRFSALAPNFTDETAALVEGKHITNTDNGKILISEPLANANQLSVGDTLTLSHARLGESDGAYIDEIPVKTAYVQVEVSGIYKLNTPDTSMKPTAGGIQIENYWKLNIIETSLIYLCQIIVITASTFVSAIIIMRLKPKVILSKY